MLRVGSYNLNEKPVLIADNKLFQMTVHGKTDFMSGVIFHGLNGQDVQFESLNGQGNAYACLDNNGVLFRSETPCTGSTSGGLTKQDVLNVLNSCKYYGGTLAQGQDCNAVCANPSVWGQSGSSGTCITGEFRFNDNSPYSKSLVRCEFKETGRQLTCVCCTP
jgi:hypothetical protein